MHSKNSTTYAIYSCSYRLYYLHSILLSLSHSLFLRHLCELVRSIFMRSFSILSITHEARVYFVHQQSTPPPPRRMPCGVFFWIAFLCRKTIVTHFRKSTSSFGCLPLPLPAEHTQFDEYNAYDLYYSLLWVMRTNAHQRWRKQRKKYDERRRRKPKTTKARWKSDSEKRGDGKM